MLYITIIDYYYYLLLLLSRTNYYDILYILCDSFILNCEQLLLLI